MYTKVTTTKLIAWNCQSCTDIEPQLTYKCRQTQRILGHRVDPPNTPSIPSCRYCHRRKHEDQDWGHQQRNLLPVDNIEAFLVVRHEIHNQSFFPPSYSLIPSRQVIQKSKSSPEVEKKSRSRKVIQQANERRTRIRTRPPGEKAHRGRVCIDKA